MRKIFLFSLVSGTLMAGLVAPQAPVEKQFDTWTSGHKTFFGTSYEVYQNQNLSRQNPVSNFSKWCEKEFMINNNLRS